MSKYIDADGLIAEFRKEQMQMVRHGREFSSSFMSNGDISTAWYCVEDIVENMPEAIVRCKDCKRRKDKKTGYECRIMNDDGTKYPSGDDFCSYGERK